VGPVGESARVACAAMTKKRYQPITSRPSANLADIDESPDQLSETVNAPPFSWLAGVAAPRQRMFGEATAQMFNSGGARWSADRGDKERDPSPPPDERSSLHQASQAL
jgi:hypothetical protein